MLISFGELPPMFFKAAILINLRFKLAVMTFCDAVSSEDTTESRMP